MYLYFKTDFDGVEVPVLYEDPIKAIKTLCWDSIDRICFVDNYNDFRDELRRRHWRKGDLLDFTKFQKVVDRLSFCEVSVGCPRDCNTLDEIVKNFSVISVQVDSEDYGDTEGFHLINLNKVRIQKRQG